jgi:hypothetical protein
MESNRQYYRVDRKQISYLRFVIEAYDGIAVLSTIDPKLGVIQLNIPPGCQETVDLLLKELEKEILIEPADVCRS